MSLVSCGEIRQVFYPVFNEHFPKRDVQVSATNAEGPPVPIPNTEVKLCSAEDTWLATARENRSVLTSCLSSPLREDGLFISIEMNDSWCFYAEGPPVPIPNTEVKLCSAEDTWLATAREDRSMPTQTRETVARPFPLL
mgnify:FL=1